MRGLDESLGKAPLSTPLYDLMVRFRRSIKLYAHAWETIMPTSALKPKTPVSVPNLDAILGKPPVLPNEDAEAYEKLNDQFRRAVNPQDVIEKFFFATLSMSLGKFSVSKIIRCNCSKLSVNIPCELF